MKSKPGAAMVEMGDCYAVERAISHLNHTMLFGQKLNIWYVPTDQNMLLIRYPNQQQVPVQKRCIPGPVDLTRADDY